MLPLPPSRARRLHIAHALLGSPAPVVLLMCALRRTRGPHALELEDNWLASGPPTGGFRSSRGRASNTRWTRPSRPGEARKTRGPCEAGLRTKERPQLPRWRAQSEYCRTSAIVALLVCSNCTQPGIVRRCSLTFSRNGLCQFSFPGLGSERTSLSAVGVPAMG